jgi:hypothetical protein
MRIHDAEAKIFSEISGLPNNSDNHFLLPPFNGLISRTNDVGCPSDIAMKLSAAFMIS